MGCVSSTLLNHDDEFPQIGASTAFSHHIVSLTSTTYGLLTLDSPPSDHHSSTTTVPPTPTPPPPQPRFKLGSLFPSPLSEPHSLKSHQIQTVDYWDLMSNLDADQIPNNFHFSPLPPKSFNEENMNPNISKEVSLARKLDGEVDSNPLDRFEKNCPPNGEDKLVIYTTTLRGVRQTFEHCNAVRSAIETIGVLFVERDISMHKGFKDELGELLQGKNTNELIPPRVFLKGRYIGGIEEVMKILEEGCFWKLLQGLPRTRRGSVCDGCGGVRFFLCLSCNGSRKMVVKEESVGEKMVVVKCKDCNENGLVICPLCS